MIRAATCCLLSLLIACASSPAPNVLSTSLFPSGWQPIEAEENKNLRVDFNGDGIPDFAGYLTNAVSARALFLRLSGASGAETYLLSQEFSHVSLKYNPKNRTLSLTENSGSSSSGESTEAKFRYEKGDFVLIGATKEEYTYGNICGENESCGSDVYHFNYLTGEVEENVGSHKSRKKEKKADLVKLKEFRFEMIRP